MDKKLETKASQKYTIPWRSQKKTYPDRAGPIRWWDWSCSGNARESLKKRAALAKGDSYKV